jgi:hypothetical protein
MLKASFVGLPEAFLLVLPVALGLLALSPAWTGGVFLGLFAVAAGRLVGWLFLESLPRERRAGTWAGLMGFSRLILVAGLAFGGIAAGLAPLGVALGLLAPPLVLWAKIIVLRKIPC